MEESSFITGQVNQVGGQHNAPGNKYYPTKQKHPKPQFSKLRQGEVVQGKIIQITGYQTALVRLPIGNFHAEIHGKLLQGDELFFIVVATTPNLILKVHSVSVIKDKNPRTDKEILRLLDLPENKEFQEAVRVAITYENHILRDDIFAILRQYSTLSKSEIVSYNLESILNQLWRFKVWNIDFDSELFLKTLPFSCNLGIIVQHFHVYNNSTDYSKYFDYVANSFDIREYIIRLKTHMSNYFNDLTKSLDKNVVQDPEVLYAIDKIRSFIQSMHFQNTLTLHNNYNFQLFTPFIYKGQFKILLFTLRAIKPNLLEKNKIRSKIESTGYFDAFDYIADKTASDKIRLIDAKIQSMDDIVNNFVNYLTSLSLIVEKVLLLEESGIREVFSKTVQSSNIKSISVVL